jgi:hypothetical protein
MHSPFPNAPKDISKCTNLSARRGIAFSMGEIGECFMFYAHFFFSNPQLLHHSHLTLTHLPFPNAPKDISKCAGPSSCRGIAF